MTEDTHPSSHPPLPPTTEDDRLAWLRLLRSPKIGNAQFYKLLAKHEGSAQLALAALPEIARAARRENYDPCPEREARDEMKRGHRFGARLLYITDDLYPEELKMIADPPPILWLKGNRDLLAAHRRRIGFAGARSASTLGMSTARRIARDLSAEGVVTVSGFARGIDASTHEASLESGTIACMAGGVDVIYPKENKALAAKMAEGGLFLSEQPIGMAPIARLFPKRNRLISGLSEGLVIVEAAARSGSLITARLAGEQGREVFAVPGHPFDPRAVGCNQLIRDGATLIRSARDVLEALPAAGPLAPQRTARQTDRQDPPLSLADVPPAPPERRSLKETATLHTEILMRLSPSPVPEHLVLSDLDAPIGQVNATLTTLELEGRIARGPGGTLSLLKSA